MRAAVQRVLVRYRQEYGHYFRNIDIEDDEAVLDQMVSLWAGRFTGKLKQPTTDLASDVKGLDLKGELNNTKLDTPSDNGSDVA